MQALVAAISDPPSNIPSELRDRNGDPSNIMLNLQHDVGKWCTEYTWSAEDGMWGVRVLHNFGRLGMSDAVEDGGKGDRVKVKRVDEEDAVEGGLKGRVSIGAELYFSAKERSAGGELHLLDIRHSSSILTCNSFNRNPLHNSTRCYTSFIPSTLIIIIIKPRLTL